MVRAGRNKINERSAGEREEGKERGPGLKRGGKIVFHPLTGEICGESPAVRIERSGLVIEGQTRFKSLIRIGGAL